MDLFKKYQFSPDFYLQLFMMSSISNESTFQSVAEAHNSEKHRASSFERIAANQK